MFKLTLIKNKIKPVSSGIQFWSVASSYPRLSLAYFFLNWITIFSSTISKLSVNRGNCFPITSDSVTSSHRCISIRTQSSLDDLYDFARKLNREGEKTFIVCFSDKIKDEFQCPYTLFRYNCMYCTITIFQWSHQSNFSRKLLLIVWNVADPDLRPCDFAEQFNTHCLHFRFYISIQFIKTLKCNSNKISTKSDSIKFTMKTKFGIDRLDLLVFH